LELTLTKKVLLIDDDPTVREAVVAYLEVQGYEVHAAANGDEALGCWSDFAPNVIVTDNRMQGISGIEVISYIRKRVQVPAVIFSGNVDESLRQAAERVGAEVVEKPDFERLLEALAARVGE
jgi:two-component system nitrogen regulation response regulator NtrX